jgi:hypothetical protein
MSQINLKSHPHRVFLQLHQAAELFFVAERFESASLHEVVKITWQGGKPHGKTSHT